MNTEITNRVGVCQAMLTRTRNMCTEVETLTSGPGVVITIKDLNDIMTDFCKKTLV